MSLLLQSIMGGGFECLPNDDRLQMPSYSLLDWKDPVDEIWPRSIFRSTGLTMAEAPLNNAPLIWDWTFYTSTGPAAGQRRNTVSGVTRGPGGVVSGATVDLYRTLTDEVVDTVTSDASGNYTATSPYGAEAVYARGHKSGTPDLDGVTVQTLTPA